MTHLTTNELCPLCGLHTVTVTDVGGRFCKNIGCEYAEPPQSPCPRCDNKGYYIDNDEEGYRGRGNNRVRCDCPAGDPENDA